MGGRSNPEPGLDAVVELPDGQIRHDFMIAVHALLSKQAPYFFGAGMALPRLIEPPPSLT